MSPSARSDPRLAALLAALARGSSPAARPSTASSALRSAADADPMGTLASTVAAATFAFYAAERGKNPKVNGLSDALVFVTTSLSVGYSDIFARTTAGKAIASLLMSLGPALSARVLEEPGKTTRDEDEARALRGELRALVGRLDSLAKALDASAARDLTPATGPRDP
jgi:voltage-gated potassium channel